MGPLLVATLFVALREQQISLPVLVDGRAETVQLDAGADASQAARTFCEQHNLDQSHLPAIVRALLSKQQRNRAPNVDAKCMNGLQIVTPGEISQAVQLFRRDGFVVVRDVLDIRHLLQLRAAAKTMVSDIVANDVGSTGFRRYSFGAASATGSLLHLHEWAALTELNTTFSILAAIFASEDFVVSSAGGDFCLPGADYQPLHSDLGDRRVLYDVAGEAVQTLGSFWDDQQQLTYRDLPTPFIAVNFPLVAFSEANGPMRQVPATQRSPEPIPALQDESPEMKATSLCPIPIGAAIIRDVRGWHGGTPYLAGAGSSKGLDDARVMASVEYFAPWYREEFSLTMPAAVFSKLTPRGQRMCRYVQAP
jgi:hypothetical protein